MTVSAVISATELLTATTTSTTFVRRLMHGYYVDERTMWYSDVPVAVRFNPIDQEVYDSLVSSDDSNSYDPLIIKYRMHIKGMRFMVAHSAWRVQRLRLKLSNEPGEMKRIEGVYEDIRSSFEACCRRIRKELLVEADDFVYNYVHLAEVVMDEMVIKLSTDAIDTEAKQRHDFERAVGDDTKSKSGDFLVDSIGYHVINILKSSSFYHDGGGTVTSPELSKVNTNKRGGDDSKESSESNKKRLRFSESEPVRLSPTPSTPPPADAIRPAPLKSFYGASLDEKGSSVLKLRSFGWYQYHTWLHSDPSELCNGVSKTTAKEVQTRYWIMYLVNDEKGRTWPEVGRPHIPKNKTWSKLINRKMAVNPFSKMKTMYIDPIISHWVPEDALMTNVVDTSEPFKLEESNIMGVISRLPNTPAEWQHLLNYYMIEYADYTARRDANLATLSYMSQQWGQGDDETTEIVYHPSKLTLDLTTYPDALVHPEFPLLPSDYVP